MKKIFYFVLPILLFLPIYFVNAGIAEDTSGKILLQVEANGEAWYVYPNTLERYYLGRPSDAFDVMRNLGLGVGHDELKAYLAGTFPSRLSGLIMLDVEANGEAYYVYPNDRKGYYLGRPADAFDVMRNLGLGITNANLAQINIAGDSKESGTQEEVFSVEGSFLSNVTTSISGNEITVMSDGLPNHETGDFPNSGNPNMISEQDHEFTFSLNPVKNSYTTTSEAAVFAIAVNGVPIEPLTAEFWNNDRDSGWNLEWSTNNLGFDFNNAHVQPDGTYHYHGSPTSLLAEIDGKAQTLIAYAADGFPVYVENLKSSWRIKSGTRPDGPGGSYDGTYVQDYEYVDGLGDLDECNGYYGATPEYPNGTYYYVLTVHEFPYYGRCFYGTPNDSFIKGPGELGQGPGGGMPPPPRY